MSDAHAAAVEAMAGALAADDPDPFKMHGEVHMPWYRDRAEPVLAALTTSEAVRAALVGALNEASDEVTDDPHRAHDQHRYHFRCHVCRGDLPALADAILAALSPGEAG